MGDRNERGSATIEAAMVVGILLMLALGAFEYGLAFREWSTVSAATREGARVAAAAGDNTQADCLVLEATAGSLQSMPADAIAEVWVYQSDTNGSVIKANRYRPRQDSDPVSLTCGVDWFTIAKSWPEADRVDTGTSRDWVGVRVVFDHAWKTGFLWFTGRVNWSEDTVMRLEPSI